MAIGLFVARLVVHAASFVLLYFHTLHKNRWVIAGVATGAAVAASGMWFLSTRTAKRFWDPATDVGELEGLRLQTNALSVVSVGAGGLALGLTGVAVVLRRW